MLCNRFRSIAQFRANRRVRYPRIVPSNRKVHNSDGSISEKRIRNIGILAHIDAGKTTTTERMLYYSGRTNMLGEVHQGNTVTDFLQQERERGITICSAAVSFDWKDHRINLLDTPGHIDFTMEVEQSLSAVDGAVIILDGSAGVEAQTVTVWGQADRHHLPRLVFVNKMDKENANFEACLEEIKKTLGAVPVPLQMPLKEGNKLVAQAIIESNSLENVKLNLVLDAIRNCTLKQVRSKFITANGTTETIQRIYEPLADEFREIDSFAAGNIGLCAGPKSTVTGDLLVANAATLKKALKRLVNTVGDSEDQSEIDTEQILTSKLGIHTTVPDAVFFCSIEPPSAAQQTALDNALREIQREDPSLRVRYDEETGQTVLGGMGQLHLEIVKSRILSEYRIEADLGPLQIAYKETLLESQRGQWTAEKEIAGSKQLVQIDATIFPSTKGNEERIVLDNSAEAQENLKLVRPRQMAFFRKGALGALQRGPKLGGQLANCAVKLHALTVGKGTTDTFIMAAAAQCISNILSKAECRLLEPDMFLEIVTINEYVSPIVADLSRRRARIEDISPRGSSNKVIKVIAPLAELGDYSTVLRTISSGTASVSMEPNGHSILNDSNEALQRIITTTQPPHNVASTAGSTIQYQIPPNVIKTTTPPESVSTTATNLTQQTTQIGPPQQTTVQYTTTRGHKGAAVVNAGSIASVTGAPTVGGTTGGIVGVSGGPLITNMSPGVQSQGPPQSVQGQAQLQRLKVEDALSYLDQVKFRFGNQPQVYNDFLDIMKEFKSQSIDTPGVIQRVSSLFKGHPELIVGFNTFLPPGYKIELQANDQGYAFQVSVSMPSSSSTGTSIAQQPSPHKYNTIFQGGGQIVQSGGGTNVVNAGSTTAVNLMAYGGGHAAATTVSAATGANAPSHAGSLQQATGGSVGNASPATAQNAQPITQQTTSASSVGGTVVPQVPQNFVSRAEHHQQQHHRERTISTGSVTSNASLPSTTSSTVVTAIDASQQQQQNMHRMISQQLISQQQTVGTGAASAAGGGGLVSVTVASQAPQQHHQQSTSTHQQQQQQQQIPQQHQQVSSEGGPTVPTAASTTTTVVAAVATTNQPVEFNHAISYVNKIKNRFHSEPEKYKRFLEILHTYQKEQKTYKEGAQAGGCMTNSKQLTEAEVYTQVAQLFDNQEDLLREFVVHGGAGGGGGGGSKKLTNSGAMGGALPNASLKMYNNLQQANMARMAHERDYSPIGNSQTEGKEYSIVSSVPAGSMPGPRGGSGMVGGVGGAGGVVFMDKDRNHIAPGGGGPGAGSVGAGGLNSKYIHGASLGTITAGAGTGMVAHGASGAVLPQVAPPGMVGSGVVSVMANLASSGGSNAVKRSPSYSSQIVLGGAGGGGGAMSAGRGDRGDGSGPPPIKRHKPICRDVSLAEAAKYGALNDYAFFDKVRNALRSPDSYENFLRCLTLYNQEIVSKSELVTLVSPFLSRFPDLLKWFQDFLGPASSGTGSGVNECIPLTAAAAAAAARQDRSQGGELAADIDLSTCKRLGASYCALPKSLESVKCSGRTSLCRDVLNDTWVSFPTWAEDSTFVTSRKTQYEEFIYRCEDERFELDVVIETNSATIRVLEGIQKKLTRMSQDEISRFRLDDCLGGTSPTIHQRALKRIYGDKAADMIQGLKKNPAVAVPVVLRRMKAKEEEWREAQKTGIQKQEKARIKHILRQFVPDLFFAPRQLMSEDEREEDDKDADGEQVEEDGNGAKSSGKKSSSTNNWAYKSCNAANSSSNFGETVGATVSTGASSSSRTEGGSNTTKDEGSDSGTNADGSSHKITSTSEVPSAAGTAGPHPNADSNGGGSGNEIIVDGSTATDKQLAIKKEVKDESESPVGTGTNEGVSSAATAQDQQTSSSGSTGGGGSQAPQPMSPPLPPHAVSKHIEEAYTLFFTNNSWYLFLRLHAILCDRLRIIYERAQIIAAEERAYESTRNSSTAMALRLKPKNEHRIEQYYNIFLDMLKNLLDGNMEASNYEDLLREMFGIHAYSAFTMDKVVQNAVRQLQHCVTERGATEVVELYQAEQRRGGAGGLCRTANRRIAAELAYQRKAESILQDENCFKVYIVIQNRLSLNDRAAGYRV
ncbi:hypothetical protein ZHAS_00007434 [Anopheles sinensis]|uniref:Paired amphipathic helix protein Sin3b n=1 Tax=Anopheles sinensis TaxID=74873 RepID=A0A084VP47_ANOSI|nr:hypothetical protein ZHAS_00007434 [Anopheles sinensis]